MPVAHVVFERFLQDTQTFEFFEQSEDHLISKVFFTLDVEGNHFDDMYVEVRQPFGTRFEDDPVEVSRAFGSYEGNWNHQVFADLVEAYVRQLIGSRGSGIRIEGGSNVRTQDNSFIFQQEAEFAIPD